MAEALNRDLSGQEEEIRALSARDPVFSAMVERYEAISARQRASADGADRPDLSAQRDQLLDDIANYMIEAEEDIDDEKTI